MKDRGWTYNKNLTKEQNLHCSKLDTKTLDGAYVFQRFYLRQNRDNPEILETERLEKEKARNKKT